MPINYVFINELLFTTVADCTKYWPLYDTIHITESCHHAKVAKLFPRMGNKFYHLIITLATCTRLLDQVIYMKNRWIGSIPRTQSTSCVTMDCKVTNFEHDYWASSVSCGILMVLPLYRQCTAAVYIQSVPSSLTCYGRSNMNACIPSMTCHPRFLGPHFFSVLLTHILNFFITKCSPVCLPQMKEVFQFFSTWTA